MHPYPLQHGKELHHKYLCGDCRLLSYVISIYRSKEVDFGLWLSGLGESFSVFAVGFRVESAIIEDFRSTAGADSSLEK
ncbi:hypothetical protein POTOM_003499 [Populus tomentosa]|uniref:Uncharacterized protein n=1 Tax=Populus tomentosa TaxID=118781 RepID=A0A8X8DLE3_POPTO|nr:hypothetical protein POTOM_003499 [Populus tomentosa]